MESINVTISALDYLMTDTRIRYMQNMTMIPIKVTFSDVTLPVGSIARIYIKKPSGREVFNDCTLQNNIVTIAPTAQMFVESGLHKATIQITHAGKILVSKPLIFDVLADYSSQGAIESSNEFTALLNALDRVENATGGGAGSGSGTGRYIDLIGKPQINNVELVGNKTLANLGIQPKGDYALRTDLDTKLDKNWGTYNSGKFLGIGTNGMVTTMVGTGGGTPGEPGKTPIKGVDYWTPADKQEMVNDVLAALQTWNGGRY